MIDQVMIQGGNGVRYVGGTMKEFNEDCLISHAARLCARGIHPFIDLNACGDIRFAVAAIALDDRVCHTAVGFPLDLLTPNVIGFLVSPCATEGALLPMVQGIVCGLPVVPQDTTVFFTATFTDSSFRTSSISAPMFFI